VTGDLVTFDVFDLSNYAASITVKATASVDTNGNTTTSFAITFTDPGPGMELLGLGANPASPITLDLGAIIDAIGKTTMSGTIHNTTDGTVSTVDYELDSPGTPLRSVFDGGPTSFKLVDITGAHEDGVQTFIAPVWDMRYAESHAAYLDGGIEIDVSGGDFDYHVKYTYPHRKEPDVALSCITR